MLVLHAGTPGLPQGGGNGPYVPIGSPAARRLA